MLVPLSSSGRVDVRQAASDSGGVARARHAVIGAVIGAAVGAVVGYRRGKAADASCNSECGGPRIGVLLLPPFYGLLGSAAGAIAGYLFPI
jgi:hypothetical protein